MNAATHFDGQNSGCKTATSCPRDGKDAGAGEELNENAVQTSGDSSAAASAIVREDVVLMLESENKVETKVKWGGRPEGLYVMA